MALTAKLDSSNWVFHLPFIVLSLNTMFKSDLHGSPAELLYGQCLRLPGDFFLSSTTSHDSSHELICDMTKFARSLKPSCTRVKQGSTVYIFRTPSTPAQAYSSEKVPLRAICHHHIQGLILSFQKTIKFLLF